MKMPIERKRVRAQKPNVRTGCMTCKTRHVKCDESKPICVRCQRLGESCGYETIFRRQRNMGTPIEPRDNQAPEDGYAQLDGFAAIKSRLSFHSMRNPSAAVFKDSTERRYFELFREEVVIMICGHFEAPFWTSFFWTRLLPQLCHHEPAIRYGIVALGALYKSSKSAANSEYSKEAHRRYAFLHQSMALRCLRESLFGENSISRLPLMASVLFSLFESLLSNWKTALQQLSSARSLLKYCKTVPVDDNEAKLSTASSSVDNQILQSLEQMEVFMVSFLVLNPVYELLEADEQDYKELENIPDQLPKLPGYHAQVATFTLKQVRTADRYITSEASNKPREVVGREWAVFQKGFKPSRQFYKFWNQPFNPILLDETSNKYSKEYLGALKLHLQSEAIGLMVSACMGWKETAFDHFKYVVRSCRLALETEQKYWAEGEPVVKLNLGVFICLYYSATRCRDSALRREAIQILQKFPSTSGVGVQAAQVAEWVAGMEETGRDLEGFIVTWKESFQKSAERGPAP